MRYLNKITFINSASIKYSEVNLDGNIHFIGTQGVGKSTLLRAILFFYNADKTKLGIPKEKKTFDEYYFPYQNSYIIFEVFKDTFSFSVMAFKRQGRVAFRFLNTAYKKTFFLDEDGFAFDSWDMIRDNLSREDVKWSNIVNFYEDYRNIIYGNNKGLDSSLRKYAFIESKQYQNIPRTIQNVFLNSKLDAEFIKQTIIKSLNEEELTIDLDTYSHHHLKDFELQLNDIKLWSDKNKRGEVVVRNQADAVSTAFRDFSFLKTEKEVLSKQLGWALKTGNSLLPKYTISFNEQISNKEKLKNESSNLDAVYGENKEKSDRLLGALTAKLETLSSKKADYDKKNIDLIIRKFASKDSLNLAKQHFEEESVLLTSQFSDIQQKYTAIINQFKNQLDTYINKQNTTKHVLKEDFYSFREAKNLKYKTMSDDIVQQDKANLDGAILTIKNLNIAIRDLELKKSEIKHKRFYENDINNCKEEAVRLREAKYKHENVISQSKKKIINIEKEWDLENKRTEWECEKDIDKFTASKKLLEDDISSIKLKLENSKDSFYAWLNENMPDWNSNIGKLIDEDNILFRKDLNPSKFPDMVFSLYGVKVDLDNVKKTVKTVDDYKKEVEQLGIQLRIINKQISDSCTNKEKEFNDLKLKYSPLIAELRELILNTEYELNKSKLDIDSNIVLLSELDLKAKNEKFSEIKALQDKISEKRNEESLATAELNKLKKLTESEILDLDEERDNIIDQEQKKMNMYIALIDAKIEEEKKSASSKIDNIEKNLNNELVDKGLDIKRLEEIVVEGDKLSAELNFIEDNMTLFTEYNKDKRELFDKETEFNRDKLLIEKQVEIEKVNHKKEKLRLKQEIAVISKEIKILNDKILNLKNDNLKFEEFKKSELYSDIRIYVENENDLLENDKSAADLISDIIAKSATQSKRFSELKDEIINFTGNFQENNIFKFKIKFPNPVDYILFARELKSFIDDDRISDYETRVNERFAHIVIQLGKETNELLSKEGEIQTVINKINSDFGDKNFVGAIKKMRMRIVPSSNKIMKLLSEIKDYSESNGIELGAANLFSSGNISTSNSKAVKLLKDLVYEMNLSKESTISLSDSFGLEFRIVENDNDTGWVERLSNVGSEGTDVLVKAMINIMLLNVFKLSASKKHTDFKLHCMMDEIGKLHPNNVKGILKFANDRNILLINGSPTSLNAPDYMYTYLLSKDAKNVTTVKALIKKRSNVLV